MSDGRSRNCRSVSVVVERRVQSPSHFGNNHKRPIIVVLHDSCQSVGQFDQRWSSLTGFEFHSPTFLIRRRLAKKLSDILTFIQLRLINNRKQTITCTLFDCNMVNDFLFTDNHGDLRFPDFTETSISQKVLKFQINWIKSDRNFHDITNSWL